MWNVRVFVESLVEQGLSALKYASRGVYTRQLDPSTVAKQTYKYNFKGLAKERGKSTIAECATNDIASSQGGVGGVGSGVICKLRPVTSRLVQSLLRKVSSPLWSEAKRRATKRLVYGETAPFFALVGVTLVSGYEQGILTKDDEVEALCGNIRDAISRVGWLHDPEFWEQYKDNLNNDGSFGSTSQNVKVNSHVFSLADLELGNVIDKGCNAVVYAARWKEVSKEITQEVADSNSNSSSSDQLNIQSTEGSTPELTSSSSNFNNDIFIELNEGEDQYYTPSDSDSNTNIHRSASQFINIPQPIEQRHRSTSLSEDISRLLADGRFLYPRRNKRVKLKIFSEDESSDSEQEDGVVKVNRARKKQKKKVINDALLEEKSSIQTYPLAVKMMFNYEAESNAPAIISAMYKELIPARTLQLNETLNLWRDRFFSNLNTLSHHCNIVEMPCVFVDRVPSLKNSMELYPHALPSRINPDGYGRNMSLFCVMKRYDISLSDYLAQYSPSSHTSLLLMTQLLEAVLHLNNNNIAHRDMKSDNILLSLSEGWDYPLLVLSDFGCCISDQSANLRIPFPSYESDPRQGNAALMAPEVKNATPGLIKKIDYSKSDLWAVGAIAFELFGHENPFMPFIKGDENKAGLDSGTYKDYNVPRLPKDISGAVRRLILDLLRRNPRNRPTPTVAATLCQLMLWSPRKWLNRHALILPSHKEISQWLLCLTTKVLCEARLTQSNSSNKKKYDGDNKSSDYGSVLLEYQLVSSFLTRVKYTDIIQAIKWNRSF